MVAPDAPRHVDDRLWSIPIVGLLARIPLGKGDGDMFRGCCVDVRRAQVPRMGRAWRDAQ